MPLGLDFASMACHYFFADGQANARAFILRAFQALENIEDFDRYNTAYASFFTGIRPARTTVQSVLADGIN